MMTLLFNERDVFRPYKNKKIPGLCPGLQFDINDEVYGLASMGMRLKKRSDPFIGIGSFNQYWRKNLFHEIRILQICSALANCLKRDL